MSSIFSFESPLWKFLGRVADAFILTIFWLICSLPIITVGASTAALYASTLRMMRNEDNGIARQFFSDFKTNFVQGTITGIIMAIIGGILAFNVYSLYVDFSSNNGSSQSSVLMIAMLIFSYVFLMVFKYIFGVIARFSNTLPRLFTIAFVLSVKYFAWTLLMVTLTVCIIVVGIFVFWPVLLFSVGAIALFDSWILEKVFSAYIEENNIR